MNIDLDAIRALQQDREQLCEDISRQAQSMTLRGTRAAARLERLNTARANEITLTRLQTEVLRSETTADQYRRLFKTLRCSMQ